MNVYTQLIHSLLHARIQLWIWHTQTGSYALHKSLGDAYESFEAFVDSVTESLMADEDISLAGTLEPFVDISSAPSTQTAAASKLLVSLETELNALKAPADILNQRDELVFKLRHARYMMTLS